MSQDLQKANILAVFEMIEGLLDSNGLRNSYRESNEFFIDNVP
jgi:hypothetical protein